MVLYIYILQGDDVAEKSDSVSTAMSVRMAQLKRRQLQGKDKWPCKVAPGLFIGAVGAARNLKALRKRGITHIVNASPIVPCYFRDAPSPGTIQYHCVPIYDDESADLLSHLDQTVNFIAEGRKTGAVLVHCFAGQSRSAALVMGYLMCKEGMTLENALKMVSLARQDAQPNQGFMHQLAVYERTLRDVHLLHT